MEIRLRLDAVTGEWRAYGPDGHYRTFSYLSELRATVSKVIEDYAATLVRIGNAAPP